MPPPGLKPTISRIVLPLKYAVESKPDEVGAADGAVVAGRAGADVGVACSIVIAAGVGLGAGVQVGTGVHVGVEVGVGVGRESRWGQASKLEPAST